ncbi:MAG: SCO family protein [Alphaproteobacteria bacterium]|nr:MAG: SCO family protein [Alphaproteobacteria bacterium]
MRLATAILVALTVLAGPALAVSDAARDPGALPEIGPAPAFALMSQDGKPVNLIGLRGKVVAVSFFYTACPDICPLLTQKLVEVQDSLGEDFGSKIAFISITVDPEHDTQEVLKDYAAGWEAKTAGWSFLSGPPAAVHEVVRRYGVYAAKTAEGAIDHTLLTSIIDPRGVLRVQYLGMRFDPAEFRRDLLSLVTK